MQICRSLRRPFSHLLLLDGTRHARHMTIGVATLRTMSAKLARMLVSSDISEELRHHKFMSDHCSGMSM